MCKNLFQWSVLKIHRWSLPQEALLWILQEKICNAFPGRKGKQQRLRQGSLESSHQRALCSLWNLTALHFITTQLVSLCF